MTDWRSTPGHAHDFLKSGTTAERRTTRRSRATTRGSKSGADSLCGAMLRGIGYSHKEAQNSQKNSNHLKVFSVNLCVLCASMVVCISRSYYHRATEVHREIRK